jgi:hypothetical protein
MTVASAGPAHVSAVISDQSSYAIWKNRIQGKYTTKYNVWRRSQDKSADVIQGAYELELSYSFPYSGSVSWKFIPR